MPTQPQSNRPRAAHGLATVEFVVVAPLLLLLMLAVAELGRALYQYNTLTKAVYTAARYYAANALTNEPAASAAATLLVQYGNTTGSGDPLLPLPLPDVPPPSYTRNFDATVSASYTFSFLPGNPLTGILTLLGGLGVPNSIVLTSTVTLRAI